MKALLLLAVLIRLPAQPRISQMEEVGRENLPAQKLGIDDLVAVSVYDAPELTRSVRVEPDGTFTCPCLKTASRRRLVPSRAGGQSDRRAQERRDSGGPRRQNHGRRISQPAHLRDGRRKETGYVSIRGRGDAAGRAGPRPRVSRIRPVPKSW